MAGKKSCMTLGTQWNMVPLAVKTKSIKIYYESIHLLWTMVLVPIWVFFFLPLSLKGIVIRTFITAFPGAPLHLMASGSYMGQSRSWYQAEADIFLFVSLFFMEHQSLWHISLHRHISHGYITLWAQILAEVSACKSQ